MGYSSIYSPIHAYALQRALPSPPNETVIEGCARPRRSTHIAGKMILSNQKWSLSIRVAYLVLIGTGPLKRRVPHSDES